MKRERIRAGEREKIGHNPTGEMNHARRGGGAAIRRSDSDNVPPASRQRVEMATDISAVISDENGDSKRWPDAAR